MGDTPLIVPKFFFRKKNHDFLEKRTKNGTLLLRATDMGAFALCRFCIVSLLHCVAFALFHCAFVKQARALGGDGGLRRHARFDDGVMASWRDGVTPEMEGSDA